MSFGEIKASALSGARVNAVDKLRLYAFGVVLWFHDAAKHPWVIMAHSSVMRQNATIVRIFYFRIYGIPATGERVGVFVILVFIKFSLWSIKNLAPPTWDGRGMGSTGEYLS